MKAEVHGSNGVDVPWTKVYAPDVHVFLPMFRIRIRCQPEGGQAADCTGASVGRGAGGERRGGHGNGSGVGTREDEHDRGDHEPIAGADGRGRERAHGRNPPAAASGPAPASRDAGLICGLDTAGAAREPGMVQVRRILRGTRTFPVMDAAVRTRSLRGPESGPFHAARPAVRHRCHRSSRGGASSERLCPARIGPRWSCRPSCGGDTRVRRTRRSQDAFPQDASVRRTRRSRNGPFPGRPRRWEAPFPAPSPP